MERTDKEIYALYKKSYDISIRNHNRITLHFFDGTKLDALVKEADITSITIFTTDKNKTIVYELSQIKDVS